jgi:hypothetical protein
VGTVWHCISSVETSTRCHLLPILCFHDNHYGWCLDVPVFTGISKSASLRSCRESQYSHHDDWITDILELATVLRTHKFLPDGQYPAAISFLAVQRSLMVSIILVSQFVATTTNRFRNFNRTNQLLIIVATYGGRLRIEKANNETTNRIRM